MNKWNKEKTNELFKEEMKGFEINIDDIQPSNELFNTMEKAIIKLRNEYYINKIEVVLNDNLIETKDKYTGYRTILGCRVSYDNLPKDVSFVVREDTKPTYEELQQRIDKAMEMLTQNKELAKEVENGYAEEICGKGINILEG